MKYINNPDEDSIKISLAKTSISTFVARVISFLLSIIITIIIARILGPTGKGIWAALVLVPTMTYALLNLGIESSNVYFLGRRKYSINQIITNSFQIAFVVLLIIFFIYFVGFERIYNFLAGKYPGFTPRHLYLMPLALPFVFIFNYMNGVLQGKERIYAANIISVISQLFTIIGILIALLVFKLNLLGLVYVYLGVRVINTIIILSVVREKESIKPKLSINSNLLKDSLKYGVKSYLASGLEMLNFRADVFLIYAFLGPRPLGFYTVAVAISEIIWFVSHSVAFPLFPRISSLGKEASKSLVIKTSRIVFWLSLLSSILLAGVVYWLIPILFGQSFIPSVKIVYFLLPGILLFSPVMTISTYFRGIGRPQVNTFVNLITLFINITLNLILIPGMGIVGAAIASAISYSLTYVIYLFLYRKETGISPVEFFLFQKEDFKKI